MKFDISHKALVNFIFLIFAFSIAVHAQDKNEKVFQAIEKLGTTQKVQEGKQLKYILNKRGGVEIIQGALSAPINAGNLEIGVKHFLETNKDMFKIANVNEELKLNKVQNDQSGLSHVRYDQYYQGIPVLGRELSVHINKNNEINAVTSNYVPEIHLQTTTASFNSDAAIQRVKTINNITIKKALIEEAKLVVYHSDELNQDYLAYKVKIAAGFKFDMDVILDASTGEVLRSYTNIESGSVNGTGTDAKGNTVSPLHIYQGTNFPTNNNTVLANIRGNTGAYNMVDLVHTGLGNIYGLNANHDDLVSGMYYDFSTVDYIYNSTSTFGSTSQVQRAGVSGAVGFEETLDYYYTQHNRNGIDNNGMDVIHIQDWYDSADPINAFWDGSLGFMVFSLGGTYGSTTYRPLSADIDVVAHELTHGVTDRTSGLNYENHSGALNESMSDIFGYLVEAYATNDYTDWLMGEDIYASGGAGAFRSLADPTLFGDPDRVGGTNYVAPVSNPTSSNDYGGVHTNSGIPNKVFYLMVAGGTHYGVTVTPFSTNLATSASLVSDLEYLVNTGGYYTATTNFDQARTLMEAACQALYPNDSTKLLSVQSAWYSVNVGSQPGGNQNAVYASLPYTTGFESGALDQYWSTTSSSSTYGRIQVTSANTPHSGSYQLTMDVNTSGNYNTNEAWLHLDLSGYSQVQLDFWWKEFGDETNTQDGVYFSDDGGANFVKVQDLNGASYTDNTWQSFSLDVDQLAAANSLSLSGTFVIKFQQYDNYPIPTDGHAYDDISVTGSTGSNIPPIANANGPYTGTTNQSISFSSSGSSDSDGSIASYHWDFGDSGTSTSANPTHTYTSDGTYTVILTVTDNDSATDSDTTTATVSSGGGSYVTLTFDDFESGFGNYTDGGSDCSRYTGGTYAWSGSAAIDIQDNSGVASSFYLTNGVDVATAGYTNIKIEFYFVAISMETNEDFFVQYYDGSSWNTVADFVSGTDFSNNTFYLATVTVPEAQYTFPANMKVRFMCDASNNSDDVYIDDITISAAVNPSSIIAGHSISETGKGQITDVAESENTLELPKEFALEQNYPNPFNPATEIRYSLPEAGYVSIKVYDLLGREVKELVNETKSAGVYTIDFNANDLSSGIYIYTIKANNFIQSRKMILLK